MKRSSEINAPVEGSIGLVLGDRVQPAILTFFFSSSCFSHREMEADAEIRRGPLPPLDHWSVQSGLLESFMSLPYAVCVVSVGNDETGGPFRVGLYMNPVDSSCYRMIARVLYSKPGDIPFNRHSSPAVAIAVGEVVALGSAALYDRTNLFVQSMHLGNNSQVADPVSGEIVLGSDHEPYFYHVHLICRGNPGRSYFEGSDKLGGPPIGEIFGVRDHRKSDVMSSGFQAVRKGIAAVLKTSVHFASIAEFAV